MQDRGPHETHRLPLIRPLDPVAAVADALRRRRAPPDHRPAVAAEALGNHDIAGL